MKPSAATHNKRRAIALLRSAAIVEGDKHFDDHLIEFRNDGWTVQHPITERIDGSLFDCDLAHWDGADIGYRGRYVLTHDEDGQLHIGEQVDARGDARIGEPIDLTDPDA